jgi:predicted TIM-barrel fold metal-dependent hydrolase
VALKAQLDHVRSEERRVPVRVVDCDVHLKPKSAAEIQEHMPEPWRSRANAQRLLEAGPIYRPYAYINRTDSIPADGSPPGSDPELVEQQLFVDAGVDIAINIPSGPPLMPAVDPEVNSAICSAVNEWQAASWLGPFNTSERYRGSIAVPLNNPARAVQEIEKWAGHPYFIQLFAPHYSGAPYGAPRFQPIWEAASRHGLPVAFHTNRGAEDPFVSPVGHFQRYGEANGIGYPLVYAAQLVSFLSEGVFSKFPDFRVVFIEGGFSWHAPLVTRLDRAWTDLKVEIPEVTVKPSLYLRDHVRFSSQPVEEPEDPADLVAMYEWCDAEHVLMFASDYPHWDYDHPGRSISARLDERVRRRIYHGNAIEFYRLDDTRPSGSADEELSP